MAESTSVRPVPAVEKAARVLRAIADGGRPQGISELARLLNVSKGTLRDVLLTLDRLGLVNDSHLLLAAAAEPASEFHMAAGVGRRVPLSTGCVVKVIAKGLPIGYDDEEYLPGVRAVAAPIADKDGTPIACVMVVGFKERLDLRTLKRIGERVKVIADALARRVGTKEMIE